MAEKKEVVKIPVTMSDGSVVEFTERQKCIVTRLDDGSRKFNFKSGDALLIRPADVESLANRFMWHGVEQKFRDEFASAENAEDAFEWVTQLHARIVRGEWRESSEGTGGVSGAGLLVRALMELHSLTPQAARAFLEGKSAAEQKILRDYPPIAAKIKEIKERVPKKPAPDTSAKAAELLQGLPPGA